MRKISALIMCGMLLASSCLMADEGPQPLTSMPPAQAAVKKAESVAPAKPAALPEIKKKENAAPAAPAAVDVSKKEEAAKAEPAASKEPKSAPKVTATTRRISYFTACANQFGRGLSDIVFSPFEIPLAIVKDNERTNIIAAIPSGLMKGVGYGAIRLVAGAVETATFFVPTKPMIREFDAGWFTA